MGVIARRSNLGQTGADVKETGDGGGEGSLEACRGFHDGDENDADKGHRSDQNQIVHQPFGSGGVDRFTIDF